MYLIFTIWVIYSFCDSVRETRSNLLRRKFHTPGWHTMAPHWHLFFIDAIVTCKSWEQDSYHLLNIDETHVKFILKKRSRGWQYDSVCQNISAKPADLSWFPETHVMKGNNQVLQVVLWPPYSGLGMCALTHIHT